MKIVSELLLLAPAAAFVCLMLAVHRFDSLGKYMWAIATGMAVAFVLMLAGIYLLLNP